MKHSLKITLILLALFFTTQIFGLITISKNIEVKTTPEGITIIEHQDTLVGEPPKTESGYQSVGLLTFAIIIGTLILLLFMKLKVKKLFKYWYFFAVTITIAITLGVYIKFFDEKINFIISLILAFLIAYYKVNKRNIIIHNLSEVFVYSGIAVLLVSLFDGWLWAAFLLLIIISIYDMFAVWKSKHMIKLAKYQTQSNVFAGLSIPYKLGKTKGKIISHPDGLKHAKGAKIAILGGGDLTFPLLFSGSVMSDLLNQGFSKLIALGLSSIIAITITLALSYLLLKGKKDKFYPAMPYLTVGCIIGYLVIRLII